MKILGGILLAIGILIAGVSGLCSAVFLWPVDTSDVYHASMVGAVAVIGGIPFLIGIGLIFLGRHLLKSTGEG
ncbi:MAG: hypothetical protein P8J20_12125 [Novosphingobium sp.]|nr:hypothetical protein [Novosphingobium sp.]